MPDKILVPKEMMEFATAMNDNITELYRENKKRADGLEILATRISKLETDEYVPEEEPIMPIQDRIRRSLMSAITDLWDISLRGENPNQRGKNGDNPLEVVYLVRQALVALNKLYPEKGE